MLHNEHRISLLDTRSQTAIRSSLRILSLNDVVVELVKNALDAGAKNIDINVNYNTGFCAVKDNGRGIPPAEFGHEGKLAQAHCTSKTANDCRTYGTHGQALSSIVGVGLLYILSRTRTDKDISFLWCNNFERIGGNTHLAEELIGESGTNVKVYGLFSKIPVRHQHANKIFSTPDGARKEFERLTHSLLQFVLADQEQVEIKVWSTSSSMRYHHKPAVVRTSSTRLEASNRSVEAINSSFRQAGYCTEQQHARWSRIDLRSEKLTGLAFISLVPLPHRSLQFVSLNDKVLTPTMRSTLLSQINSYFETSTFGTVGGNHSCQYKDEPQTKSRTKLVDKRPAFVIWLNLTDMDSNIAMRAHEGGTYEELSLSVGNFVKAIVMEFLTSHGYLRHVNSSQSSPFSIRRRANLLDGPADDVEVMKTLEFRHVSKLRANNASNFDDALVGLPFRDQKAPLITVSHDSLPVDVSEVNPSPCTLTRLERKDRVIAWVDPRTRLTVQIDQRTGMILPTRPNLHHTGENSVSQQVTEDCCISRPRKRQKYVQDITVTSQKVRKHFGNGLGCENLPTRSITPNYALSEIAGSHALPLAMDQSRFWRGLQQDVDCDTFVTPTHATSISKTALAQARLCRQVDKKFILAMLPSEKSLNGTPTDTDCLLILVDQHAADERCKVEQLLRSIQEDPPVPLPTPLIFELPAVEIQRLSRKRSLLAQWKLTYCQLTTGSMSGAQAERCSTQQIQINALPAAIAERCRIKPALLIEIIREVIWREETEVRDMDYSRHTSIVKTMPRFGYKDLSLSTTYMPSRLLELLNSRACRSAIMFNDDLDATQCLDLMNRLSKCVLPFQCAHGRPSMTVALDLQSLSIYEPLQSRSASTTSSLDGWPMDACSTGTESLERSTRVAVDNTAGLNSADGDRSLSFGKAYHAWLASDTL